MNERERKFVPTTVGHLYFGYSGLSVDALLERLTNIKHEHGGDAMVELYTEYHGGNEGSAAVRVRQLKLETDKAFNHRMKALDEHEARQKKLDEEAYERVKTQRLAEGKQP